MDTTKDDEKCFYAKVLSNENQTLKLKDLTYFPTDYILRCMDGPYEGRQIRMKDLGNDFKIGSDDNCELSIKYADLDPQHCKISYIKNSIYYTIEDLSSKEGVWKVISNLEDAFEVKRDTEFVLFNYRIVIEKTTKGDKETHKLKFIEGSDELKNKEFVIEEDCNLTFGKADGMVISLDDLKCSESYQYRVVKLENRVFIINSTEEITNNGLFYRIHNLDVTLLRAGDFIKLGRTTYRILVHNWGITSEIGDRSKQEDKFCVIDDLRIFDEVNIPFYAVYDGHGGITCSLFLQKHFHKALRDIMMLKNLENSTNILIDITKAIQEAIIYTDFNYFEKSGYSASHGSTCVALFFIANKVICCNLGDSLSILYKSNNQKIFLSKDFKPDRIKEKERIESRGGEVSGGRLMSNISVSRGFGDWRYKDINNEKCLKALANHNVTFGEYLVSNRAEFRTFEIDHDSCDYIIIVSDGIFEHSSHQSVFDTINKYLKIEKKESNQLVNIPSVSDNVRLDIINSVYGNQQTKQKASDNMTLIMINLNNANK